MFANSDTINLQVSVEDVKTMKFTTVSLKHVTKSRYLNADGTNTFGNVAVSARMVMSESEADA